jgi:hypothetical protein
LRAAAYDRRAAHADRNDSMLTDDSTSYAHHRVDDDDDDDDVDYQYFWTRGDVDVPIPLWIAEILELRRGLAVELFLAGLFVGIVVVGLAVLVGFLFSIA